MNLQHQVKAIGHHFEQPFDIFALVNLKGKTAPIKKERKREKVSVSLDERERERERERVRERKRTAANKKETKYDTKKFSRYFLESF